MIQTGDLTTNNVLLVEHEEDLARPFSVKVSDFGLSRVHASESAISTNTFGTVRLLHLPACVRCCNLDGLCSRFFRFGGPYNWSLTQ